MSDAWFNFAVLIFVQLLVFLIHAYHEKKLADVPRILWQGALTGVVVGPPLDLIGAQYFGLGTYVLGFGPLFMILLGLLGWGLFAANILLMQQARFLYFSCWATLVAAVSEVLNLFLPLFTYPFAYTSIEYVTVAFGSLWVLAIAIAAVWHVVFKYRFVFLERYF